MCTLPAESRQATNSVVPTYLPNGLSALTSRLAANTNQLPEVRVFARFKADSMTCGFAPFQVGSCLAHDSDGSGCSGIVFGHRRRTASSAVIAAPKVDNRFPCSITIVPVGGYSM